MLKEIHLDSNNFKEIPNEISSLDQLEKLFVQRNALEGDIIQAGQMRLNLGAWVYCMWQVKYQMRLAIRTTYRVWHSINQLSGSLPADIGTGSSRPATTSCRR
ncbi:unnamed protein product [Prunus armeniaca]